MRAIVKLGSRVYSDRSLWVSLVNQVGVLAWIVSAFIEFTDFRCNCIVSEQETRGANINGSDLAILELHISFVFSCVLYTYIYCILKLMLSLYFNFVTIYF